MDELGVIATHGCTYKIKNFKCIQKKKNSPQGNQGNIERNLVSKINKVLFLSGIVLHVFNTSTEEAKISWSQSSRLPRTTY